jgi:hypothetical protein
MNLNLTRTFTVLRISRPAFDKIKAKLEKAGYDHAFIEEDGETLIDMNGIALAGQRRNHQLTGGPLRAVPPQRGPAR